MASLHVTTLPVEVILHISDHLLLPAQVSLALTCKHLNGILTPVVWSEIELHHCGAHEGIDLCAVGEDDWEEMEVQFEKDSSDEGMPMRYRHVVREPSGRKYLQPFDQHEWKRRLFDRDLSPNDMPKYGDDIRGFQFGREHDFLNIRGSVPEIRWQELAQHVRSLCFSVYVSDETIETISNFRNLTSLEIVGFEPYQGDDFKPSKWYPENTAPAMAPFDVRFPDLRNLKLRGFLPAAFVYNVCSHSPRLTHLNLGLLASPQDDVPHAEWIGNPDDADSEHPADDESSYDVDDTQRPLAPHSPLWVHPENHVPLNLPRLTHLHLVKPALATSADTIDGEMHLTVSREYEDAVNQEWASLIRSVCGTLKELIFDHRCTIEGGEATVWQLGGATPPGRPIDLGDMSFCKIVLSLLTEQSQLFPRLLYAAFRGLELVDDCPEYDAKGRLFEDTGDNGPRAIIQRLFPKCELETPLGTDEIALDGGDDAFDLQDLALRQDGIDGLLRCSGIYQDYVMRYGRQWKIEE